MDEILTGFRVLDTENPNSSDKPDNYHFIAFVLWYLFLVLCCVIPTCCAYRRRRLVEARLAQHHFDLQRLQQHQMSTSGHPNFLLLDQLSSGGYARPNSEHYRKLRSTEIAEKLEATTMVLKESDFESLEGEGEFYVSKIQVEAVGEDFLNDFDEKTGRIVLPDGTPNGGRKVPSLCAVCLSPYAVGDKMCWSPKTDCQHAFHKDCILEWLSKKQEEQKCPVCRQAYCDPVQVQEPVVPPDEMFLDSFAFALNYARTHARSWNGDGSYTNSTGGTSIASFLQPHIRVQVIGGNNELSFRSRADPSLNPSEDIETGGNANEPAHEEVELPEIPPITTPATNERSRGVDPDASVPSQSSTGLETIDEITTESGNVLTQSCTVSDSSSGDTGNTSNSHDAPGEASTEASIPRTSPPRDP